MKLLIAVNSSWNLFNFRAGLIRALVAAGHEVVVAAPRDEYSDKLASLGCRYVEVPIDNKGTNPVRDAKLIRSFLALLRSERPAAFLGYTIKPNVYGSLAARWLSIPTINNIAGLGAVFASDGWLNWLVRRMYMLALSRATTVFFQNQEDLDMFVLGGIVRREITDRLPGSGVDLARFAPRPPPGRKPVRFLLIARMLWDKGVGEYVQAARLLRDQGIHAEFCLLGFLDVDNPSAISREQMQAWTEEGAVKYLGTSDNVVEQIAEADCIVLPSYYREGTPKTLLEAAALARPIITCDSVGCRDVVDDGINGFLCTPRDAEHLADRMARIAAMSPAQRTDMGLRGRRKAETQFDERFVIEKYLRVISAIEKRQGRDIPTEQSRPLG